MKKFLALTSTACLLFAADLPQKDPSVKKVYDAETIAAILVNLNGDPNDITAKVNHAKGFCATGVFTPDQSINNYIDVPFLKQKSIPTEIRYSLGGALHSDKTKPRGVSVKMNGADDTSWTMVMLNTPINFAHTAEEFGKFFELRTPVNGKVDQEKLQKANKEVKSYRDFLAYSSKVGITPSVSNTPYFSVHTFWFKDKKGKEIAARWHFEPVDGVKYLSDAQLKTYPDNFLKDNFLKHIKNNAIEYKMYLTLANKGDVTDNTNALWTGKHKELLVGTLQVQNSASDKCNAMVYFPADIPAGVLPPKDPLFDIRNEAYGITFARRASYIFYE